MKPDEQPRAEEPPAGCPDASASQQWRIEVGDFQTSLAVSAEPIQAAVEQVLSDAQIVAAQISVAVVDDPTIRELNRAHLEHDYATDVLSYPLSAADGLLEGEIVISSDTARANAVDAGWAPESELLLYAIHGALHLVGFSDKTPAEAHAMRRAEAETLDRLGVARSATDCRWTTLSAPANSVGEPTSL